MSDFDLFIKVLLDEMGGPCTDENEYEMAIRVMRDQKAQLREVRASRARWRDLARALNLAHDVLTCGGTLAQCLMNEIMRCREALTDGDLEGEDE